MTRSTVRVVSAAALSFLLGLAPPVGLAQTVTGNVRGRVLSTDGAAVGFATVTATDSTTGFARSTVTDPQGRYRLVGLPPAVYVVRVQAIGHRPVAKPRVQVQVGTEAVVDFSLEATAVEVSAVSIVGEQTPLVDASKTGTNRMVGEREIQGLPTNGRNFTDFVGLSPTFAKIPSFGAGAQGGSIGGGRPGGNLIQIDGVANTGTFFGGDPRGSDRLPIAFSIEAVKEFQVLTNEYDVSKGGFTGGIINAVTRSGTNEFHGTLFEYFRNQSLTRADFLGVDPTDFRSHQFGGAFSGPVLKNKVFFFGAVDRQARQAPITAVSATVTGIADTTLTRLDSIIRNVYNVDPGRSGTYATLQNEWVLFGRLDFNLSERHRLAIRDSYTALDFTGDRIASSGTFDYSSNGGPLKPTSNSLVVNLFSNLTSKLYNEFRFQRATDHKPRPSEVDYPQVRVTLGGRVIAFGADSIIQYNLLDENTLQFTDVLTFNSGGHSIQVGTDNLRYDFYNLFFNNGLGTYSFNWGNDAATLDSLRARHASAFTRAVPISGVSPVAFPDSIPVADYIAWNYSFFVQDKWQVTPRLTINGGVRLDIPKVAGVPRNNPLLLDSFPQFFHDSATIARLRAGAGTAQDSITTAREVPARYNFAPRVGFSYDLTGDQRTFVRGGGGIFYGYTPFVFWSNMFLNTGRDQLNVACAGTTPAAQNVNLGADAPTNCGPLTPPVANAFFFSRDYRTPYAVKANLGIDRAVTESFSVGAEVTYAKTYDNYTNRDVNYRTAGALRLAGEWGRIIVGTAPTGSGSAPRRIDTRFNQVLEHDNRSIADYFAVIANTRYRTNAWDLNASYTYSRNRDDFSRSCCTSTSQYAAIEAGANTNNDLTGNFSRSENDIPHAFTVSALWRGPWGLNISGILRTFSGRPFTATISNTVDANGDGIRGNDRIYVPRNRTDISIDGNGGGAGVGTVAQQDSAYAVLAGLISAWPCLNERRGAIVERNSCRNPGRTLLDIKISREFRTIGGQSVEVMADFFNVLNGINKKWGKAINVSGASLAPLRVRGYDGVLERYVYEVQQAFGQPSIESGASLSQFQAQLAVRYRF